MFKSSLLTLFSLKNGLKRLFPFFFRRQLENGYIASLWLLGYRGLFFHKNFKINVSSTITMNARGSTTANNKRKKIKIKCQMQKYINKEKG